MVMYEKPKLAISEIEKVLENHLGPGSTEIKPLSGGNISNVFSFNHEGKGYVVKFSDLEGAYETEHYVSHLLSGQNIPFPKCLAIGRINQLTYIIMERMEGRNLSDFTAEEQTHQLPEIISILKKWLKQILGQLTAMGGSLLTATDPMYHGKTSSLP